jgi:hypothetical protein
MFDKKAFLEGHEIGGPVTWYNEYFSLHYGSFLDGSTVDLAYVDNNWFLYSYSKCQATERKESTSATSFVVLDLKVLGQRLSMA